MKLSLLSGREDFGRIIEATLGRYLTDRYGRIHRVRWDDFGGSGPDGDVQRWWGNVHLNYFAVTETCARDLAVVRREFSRSPVRWRQPFQALYVWLATAGRTRCWFAQAAFSIAPPLADAVGCLIVPGNHRIRLLWPKQRRSVVLLKSGFDRRYLSAETDIRRAQAATLAPALREVATDGTWFEEDYVEGTPLNRLPEQRSRELRAIAQARLHAHVIEQTAAVAGAVDWAAMLSAKVFAALDTAAEISGTKPARNIRAAMESLVRLVQEKSGHGRIATALTHGDFQPGNILEAGGRLWLIDWESAGRRLASYDLFCLAWNVRLDPQWAADFRRLEADDAVWNSLGGWAGHDWCEVPRRVHLILFVLEELRFVLADALDPNFRNRAARLTGVAARFEQFARALRT